MNASIPFLARALALGGLAAPWSAWATTTIPIPEPGIWSLLAVAGAAAAIVTIRNRRK